MKTRLADTLYARPGCSQRDLLACILVLPALAHAHGGMGPDEIGPPIGTAGLIGFVSYWVVMLLAFEKEARRFADWVEQSTP